MKVNLTTRFFGILALIVYGFLWTPVIFIIIFSFSSNELGIRWDEFSLKWYSELLTNPMVRDALVRSLIIAGITVVVSTTLGTISAYGLYKLRFRGKRLLRTAILLPLILPYVVTGSSLLVFFTRFVNISLGYPSIIIAHITFSTPLAVFVVLGRMQRINWDWEEAALDLGANRIRAFRRVIAPLLLPAVAASAMLVFPWSFDDFVITYFVAGVGSTTLPIYVFSQLRFGATPVINTIGTIFTAVTILGLLLFRFIEARTAGGLSGE